MRLPSCSENAGGNTCPRCPDSTHFDWMNDSQDLHLLELFRMLADKFIVLIEMIEFYGWLEQTSKAFADVLAWLQDHFYVNVFSYRGKYIFWT